MGTKKPPVRPPSAGKAKPKAKPEAPVADPNVPPGFTLHRPDASTAVLVPIEQPDFPNPPKEQGKF